MLAYASKRGPRRRLIASTTPATGGESRARLPTRNGRTRRAGCQAGPWFPTHPGPVCQCAHRFRPSVEPVTCKPDTAHRTSPPGTAPPAGPRPSGGRSETGRSQCRTSPRTSVTAKSAGGNTRTPGASDTLCGHKAHAASRIGVRCRGHRLARLAQGGLVRSDGDRLASTVLRERMTRSARRFRLRLRQA